MAKDFGNRNRKIYFYKRKLALLVYLIITVMQANCRNVIQKVQKKNIEIIIQIEPPLISSTVFCPHYVRVIFKRLC